MASRYLQRASRLHGACRDCVWSSFPPVCLLPDSSGITEAPCQSQNMSFLRLCPRSLPDHFRPCEWPPSDHSSSAPSLPRVLFCCLTCMCVQVSGAASLRVQCSRLCPLMPTPSALPVGSVPGSARQHCGAPVFQQKELEPRLSQLSL